MFGVKTKTSKEENNQLLKDLQEEIHHLYSQRRQIDYAASDARAYYDPDRHHFGHDYSTAKLPETIEELQELKADIIKANSEAKTELQELEEDTHQKMTKAFTANQEWLEQQKAELPNFDLSQYRDFVEKIDKLINFHYRYFRCCQLQGKETPEDYDWDALRREQFTLTRTPKMIEQLSTEMIQQLNIKNLTQEDLTVGQRKLLIDALSGKSLVVLTQGIPDIFNVLRVTPDSSVFLIPSLALTQEPWNETTDAVDASWLNEEEIVTIATLYGGDAYPTLREAVKGAKAF